MCVYMWEIDNRDDIDINTDIYIDTNGFVLVYWLPPLSGLESLTSTAHSVTQACLTLWDPMDCSPPGSSVHGILQARILEWVAISSSRVSSPPRDRTPVTCDPCIGRQILYH
ncbi:unnamed protein product [Rangifer tarandus platyrhynchus]|uniref:Uncharacterized protein n=1 Tax=Rangifer tarandus platyrhynchus TaxID=3082113 RepID=A0AC59ZVV7_RANTA